MWQASDETGVKRPSASTSAAMPSPVPGPRITWGPSGPNFSGPIRRSQTSGIVGNDSAWASKSLSSNPWLRPVRRAASGPSITQGAFVSLSVRRARPRVELGARRLDRLRQPRIIAGVQVDDVAEPGSGLADERKAHVGP